MDSSCKKNYCSHEIDAKSLYDKYLSAHVPYSVIKELTINIVHTFHKAFSTGMVTGNTVIDCSVGPIFYHLLAMCEFVQEITVLKSNDGCLKEIEKWKNKDEDAYDWAHTKEILQQFIKSSDELEGEEECLRGKIVKILKWDPSECDPADVCLQAKFDIAINIAILELSSKDKDEYGRKLSKMSDVIKPDGYLLLYVARNASYFSIGEDKFHLLQCDESFYRQVLSEKGFVIVHLKNFDRVMCDGTADHDGGMFIIAQKANKP